MGARRKQSDENPPQEVLPESKRRPAHVKPRRPQKPPDHWNRRFRNRRFLIIVSYESRGRAGAQGERDLVGEGRAVETVEAKRLQRRPTDRPAFHAEDRKLMAVELAPQ